MLTTFQINSININTNVNTERERETRGLDLHNIIKVRNAICDTRCRMQTNDDTDSILFEEHSDRQSFMFMAIIVLKYKIPFPIAMWLVTCESSHNFTIFLINTYPENDYLSQLKYSG